jgi:cell division protease FtsH
VNGLKAAAVALRGRTPADISMAVREARRVARRSKRPMTGQGIVRLARAALPPRTPGEDRKVAVHEAGHAIAILALGLTLKAVDLDHARNHIRIELRMMTRGDMEHTISSLLAGRAADELFGAGADSGAESDLSMASSLALSMIARYGLHDSLLVLDDIKAKTDPAVQAAAAAILDACMDEGRALLRSRALEHSALVDALLKHRYLDAGEVNAILNESTAKLSESFSNEPQTFQGDLR